MNLKLLNGLKMNSNFDIISVGGDVFKPIRELSNLSNDVNSSIYDKFKLNKTISK